MARMEMVKLVEADNKREAVGSLEASSDSAQRTGQIAIIPANSNATLMYFIFISLMNLYSSPAALTSHPAGPSI